MAREFRDRAGWLHQLISGTADLVVLLVAGNKIAIPDFSEGLGVITQPAHTMTGIIAMLGNLKNADSVGAGTALSLITILYAILTQIAVVIPFQTGIKRKIVELGEAAG